MSAHTPGTLRDLTARLVGIASASPDPRGERACAEALSAAMPAGLEHGTWSCPDGRPVHWCLRAGGSPRTVLLLGHVDTVGLEDYAALGDPAGGDLGLDPQGLRAVLLRRAGMEAGRGGSPSAVLPDRVRADLAEEALTPGTWMFGRGSLDMKSGLAAGVGAMAALAADPDLGGGVLFVATPDEERESAGMITAVGEIERMAAARGLALQGAVNLDFVSEPGLWSGVVGKVEAGCYVLGMPTHAGHPLDGVDAAQLAAEVVKRVTERRDLVDRAGDRFGPPAVTLRLRDLKTSYNVQTAHEAVAEFNLVTFRRTVAESLAIVRDAAVHALESQAESRREMADWLGGGRRVLEPGSGRARVLTWPELVERAGAGAAPVVGSNGEARAITLERLRALCHVAGITGPAVIVYALPPYYPAAAPGHGPLARAADELARAERLPILPWYPFVSDASYVAWRAEDIGAIAAHLPALGGEYHLPAAAARALDLDVITLGPWGRDAHGLYERVHAPYAFGRLPGLIADLVRRTLAG